MEEKMFKCRDCGYIFDEPVKIDSFWDEDNYEMIPLEEYCYGCPECNSEEFEEVYECEECGKYSTEFEDYCFEHNTCKNCHCECDD